MDSIETLKKAILRTSNNVFQSLRLYPIPEGASVRTDLTVLARATNGITATWRVEACCKRVGAGVVMVEANESVVQARKESGTAGWNVQASANGDSLEIKAKGDSSLEVDWQVTGSVVIFTPS